MKPGRPRKSVSHKDVRNTVAGISRHLREGDRQGAKRLVWQLIVYFDHLDLLPQRVEGADPD